MTEREPQIHEKPRVEEHLVYLVLATPVFLLTILVAFLIAMFGTHQ